jgi:hypothetical protein
MKKILSVILLSLLLISILTSGFNTGTLEASGYSARHAGRPGGEVFLPLYAVAEVNDIIGGKRVEYWEHIYGGTIQIKNDYILIHRDVDTNEIVKYSKNWRDIELPNVEIKPFTPPSGDYFWKRVVAFLNNTDLGHFYTLYDMPEYLLICWEVRYTDGTTVMYALDGNRIGHGIPAPSTRAFSLSGPHHGQDEWWRFRENAHHYFRQWVSSPTTIFNPSTATIRSNVSNPTTRLYYAIAHGGSFSFGGSKKDKTWFTIYNATMAESDMGNRGSMLFAFLGHCEGMRHTGPGTFFTCF